MFSHVQTTRTHTQVAHRDIRRFCQENGLTGPQVFEDAHGNLRLYRAPARAPLAGGGPVKKVEEEVAGDQAGHPCTEAFIANCCDDVLKQGEGIGLFKEVDKDWDVDPDQFQFIRELSEKKSSLQKDGRDKPLDETQGATLNKIEKNMKFNYISDNPKDNIIIARRDDDGNPADGSINVGLYHTLINKLKDALKSKHDATTSDTKSKLKLQSKYKYKGDDTTEINCDDQLIEQCCHIINHDNTNFNMVKLFEKIKELKKIHSELQGA